MASLFCRAFGLDLGGFIHTDDTGVRDFCPLALSFLLFPYSFTMLHKTERMETGCVMEEYRKPCMLSFAISVLFALCRLQPRVAML